MTGEGAESIGQGQPWRLHAVRTLAIVLLLLALLPESPSAVEPQALDQSTVQNVPPGDSSSADTDAPDAPMATDSSETPTVDAPLVVNRLWSPAANSARIEGTVSPTGPQEVAVIVEGVTVQTIALETDAQGSFAFTVDGLGPGAQTLCLDMVCDRVLIAEPTIEAASDTESRIREATAQAMTYFDATQHLPGWTIEVAGQNSGAGGYTDPASQTIFVSANPERSTEELTITVLHEMGHAVDTQWMDDEKRNQFRLLRSHDTSLQWGETDRTVTGTERWRNSAEDFAEVFVAWALEGAYVTASVAVANQPGPSDLTAFCELVGFTIDC